MNRGFCGFGCPPKPPFRGCKPMYVGLKIAGVVPGIWHHKMPEMVQDSSGRAYSALEMQPTGVNATSGHCRPARASRHASSRVRSMVASEPANILQRFPRLTPNEGAPNLAR